MSKLVDSLKKINWPTVIAVVSPLPFIVLGIILWRHFDLSWTPIVLSLCMFYCTGFGVTVGLHRLFTHASFETVAWVRLLLGIWGAWAIEGPIAKWVGYHRQHHQHSDKEGDPHSPHNGRGYFAGFYHSHIGCMMLKSPPIPEDAHVRKLNQDWIVRLIDDYYLWWVALGLVFPGIVGGLIMHSWMGALQCFIMASAFRVFYVHHVTWSINSICHLHGEQPWDTGDQSRNNWWVGLFGLGIGENNHNNHHAFPSSPRHGLKWYEIDLSWRLIQLLKILRLATVKAGPSQVAIDAMIRKPEQQAA